MTTEVIEIDWKRALKQLEPFIAGQGGVLAVTGQLGAASAHFERVLKKHLQRAFSASTFIKLNPEDEQTRSEAGIITTFEKKLAIELGQAPTCAAPLTGIEAGGDITIMDVTVGGKSPFQFSDELQSRASRVEDAIVGAERGVRPIIVLFNWQEMPPRVAHWFFEVLWEDGLSRGAEKGLLLVCIDEQSSGKSYLDERGPEPDVHVQLPALFEATDLDDALDDLTRHCQSTYEDLPDAARIRAETIMATSKQRPSAVISSLIALKLTLQEIRE